MNRLLIFLTFILAGCSLNNKELSVDRLKFRLPVIIQKHNADTVKAFSAENIRSFFPMLLGKYKFGDTIHYTGKRDYENLSEKDYLWEVKEPFENDSISSDGLEIIPDYSISLAYSRDNEKRYLYYPVYIINETFETKIFFGKDSYGFAIQEAVDTSDYSFWNPIESLGLDFCGNGRFRKKINPGEFLVFLLPKYSGNLKTLLRVRFQIGENIFISRPFEGIINPKQFIIDKRDWIHKSLKATKGLAYYGLFYGSKPKEIDNY